jgi:hypothetical protein
MNHIHHIIPKHMGGSNEPSNLIELTVEEHAEAHRKLWEKHGKIEDYVAWKGLSGQISLKEILKELCSHPGESNPFYGKKHTDETIKVISEKCKEKWNSLSESEKLFRLEPINKLRIGNQYAKGMTYKHSDEAKQKIRNARLGKSHITDEGKKRISEARKLTVGRKNSPETIEKMKQSAIKRHQLKINSGVE